MPNIYLLVLLILITFTQAFINFINSATYIYIVCYYDLYYELGVSDILLLLSAYGKVYELY